VLSHAELREGSETGLDRWSRTNDGDNGDGGERIDSRRGHEQGTIVEIPCKRRSAGSVVQDDSSHSVRPIVNAHRSRGVTLQSGSECKAEDGSHPRAVVELSMISTPSLG